MASFTTSAPLLRILVALCIFVVGFRTCDILNRPRPLTNDLSRILSNQTLALELPSHGDTSIRAAYIPASLNDNGRESIFWCSLLALAGGGAYIYDRIRAHIWPQLSALDEGAKGVPKGELLKFHLNGVKNLNVTGWVYSTGDRDFPMACMLSVPAIFGVLYATVASILQNIASNKVTNELDHFLSDPAAVAKATFGSSIAHGSYTLESWTCQIAPLISASGNVIQTRARDTIRQSCRDAHVARHLLLAMLPLTILMFLTALKPHWFTFTVGKDGRNPAWLAVPLKDNDSEEEEDPMAGFGGNAREQWLLQEE